MEEIHWTNAEKLLQMQTDLKKATLYNETIKKQEVVISKLEKIMEKIVEDNRIAQNGKLELEELKSEILMLQKVCKEQTFGEMLENSELERLRKEVFSLEKLLIELNGEYEEKGMKWPEVMIDWEDE